MARMTEKQRRFCDEYLIDLNATQAATQHKEESHTMYGFIVLAAYPQTRGIVN